MGVRAPLPLLEKRVNGSEKAGKSLVIEEFRLFFFYGVKAAYAFFMLPFEYGMCYNLKKNIRSG